MALPKINETPKYDMIIPSTQEKVRFRPFLVKEEKVLMMAMESNDTNQMLNSIVDTLDACVENGVAKDKLTTFDVEYMFTKLRAKSVGETSKVGVKCTQCEESNEVDINVEEIAVAVPQLEKMVELDENITVEMQWPTYSELVKMNPDGGGSTEQVFSVLRASLAAIHTKDERIDLKDESPQDIQGFIESMNREQFEKIQNFVQSMPTLSHDIKFKCEHCEHVNELKLEGMQSFF